jgi:hypothetical protein
MKMSPIPAQTSPTMRLQLIYVGLLLLSLCAIGLALYSLMAALRYFDVSVVFWYYFGGSILLALLGLLGLEVSTERLKTI